MNVETRETKVESQTKALPNTSPLLVLISAPSGGGKTAEAFGGRKAKPVRKAKATITGIMDLKLVDIFIGCYYG